MTTHSIFLLNAKFSLRKWRPENFSHHTLQLYKINVFQLPGKHSTQSKVCQHRLEMEQSEIWCCELALEELGEGGVLDSKI